MMPATFLKNDVRAPLRPLGDRLLVRRFEPMDQAAGLIIAPQTVNRESHEGEIIAVGAGRRSKAGRRLTLAVWPGDVVLFAKYAGQAFEIAGEELLLLREDDVLALLED